MVVTVAGGVCVVANASGGSVAEIVSGDEDDSVVSVFAWAGSGPVWRRCCRGDPRDCESSGARSG